MLSQIFSSLLGSGAVLVVVYLFSKKYIEQYINGYVNHEFNKRTESHKAELQAKHQEQQHFHELIIYALSQENKELKARKISAADNLWKSLVSMKKFSMAVKYLGTLNFDEIKKRADDPKVQAFLNVLQNCSFAELLKEAEFTKGNPSELVRPWVSHRAWSLYLAYTSIIYYAICQFENAKSGGQLEKIFDENKLIEVLQNALPTVTINQIFPSLLGQMHDLLEFELLVELKNSMDTKEDAAAVMRAKAIFESISGLS